MHAFLFATNPSPYLTGTHISSEEEGWPQSLVEQGAKKVFLNEQEARHLPKEWTTDWQGHPEDALYSGGKAYDNVWSSFTKSNIYEAAWLKSKN